MKSKSKSKIKIKIILDIIMSITMIVCMGYQLTGNLYHEIFGVVLFTAFFIHCLLNKFWFINYKKINKSMKGSPALALNHIVNQLLILDIVFLAISSIAISRDLFSFIGLTGGPLLVQLHNLTAKVGFALASIHLGCHWKSILSSISRRLNFPRDDNKLIKLGLRFISIIIISFGIFNSFYMNLGGNYHNKNRYGGRNGYNGGYSHNNTFYDTYSNDSTGVSDASDEMSSTDQSGLEEYLGGLTCTGCGRGCSLLYPQCGRGHQQAQAAIESYESSGGDSYEDNYGDDNGSDNYGDDDYGFGNGDGYGNGDGDGDGKHNKITVHGNYSWYNLFGGYIPIAGMYIGGTYYILEFVKKKKKGA